MQLHVEASNNNHPFNGHTLQISSLLFHLSQLISQQIECRCNIGAHTIEVRILDRSTLDEFHLPFVVHQQTLQRKPAEYKILSKSHPTKDYDQQDVNIITFQVLSKQASHLSANQV